MCLPNCTMSRQVANCHSHGRNNLKFDNYTHNSMMISFICWPQNLSSLPTLVPHFHYCSNCRLLCAVFQNYLSYCHARAVACSPRTTLPNPPTPQPTVMQFMAWTINSNIPTLPSTQGTKIGLSLKLIQIRT